MKYLKITLKGIIIGFASLGILGLSASTVAIILGIYYLMIDAISNIFKDFKHSVAFLASLILGYAIGAVIAAVVVKTLYDVAPLIIIVAVICMIAGAIPNLIKDLKRYKFTWYNLLLMLLVCGGLIAFAYLSSDNISFESVELKDYVMLGLVGFFTSGTLVVPGFDFAMVLTAIGYYPALMGAIADLIFFNEMLKNGSLLIVYLLSYSVGAFLCSKLLKKLFEKFKDTMEFINAGLILATIPVVIKKNIIDNATFTYSNSHILISIIVGIVVFFSILIFYRLTDKNDTRIDAYKKRNMFRFFFAIAHIFTTLRLYIRLRKTEKRENVSFEEKFKICNDTVKEINRCSHVIPVVKGLENIIDDNTLFISNHQGRYDGLAVITALENKPFSILVNKEKVRYPFYTDLYNLLDCIPVDKNEPREQVKAINRMADELKNGKNYMCFIEGVFYENHNNLIEFKTGLLNAAFDSKKPITPIVLYDTWKVYSISSIKKIYPEVHILKPIYYDEYKDMTKKDLAEYIKSLIQAKLDDIKKEKNGGESYEISISKS